MKKNWKVFKAVALSIGILVLAIICIYIYSTSSLVMDKCVVTEFAPKALSENIGGGDVLTKTFNDSYYAFNYSLMERIVEQISMKVV